MRIVGLDVGLRRIGIAISDASRTLARPVGVVDASVADDASVALIAAEIARLAADDEAVGTVVVGLPRRLDGSPNELTAHVRRFAERLHRHVKLPVVLQDERLTSVEAERRLSVRERDWRVRKRKLDAAAAAIILQDYLDSIPTGDRRSCETN